MRIISALFSVAFVIATGGVAQAQAGAAQAKYDCSGPVPFRGTIALTEDADSAQNFGVEKAYTGFASVQNPAQPGLSSLIMVVAGKNQSDRNINRICFSWVLSQPASGNPISISVDGDMGCKGFVVQRGAATHLVGQNGVSTMSCEIKLQLP